MFTQTLKVTYRDGHEETVITDQGDVAAWEMYATRRGFKPASADRSLLQDMPVMFLRFAAWNATHRGGGPKAEFENWAAGVLEVSVEAAADVDPTPSVTPAD